QIPPELLKAGGRKLASDIHALLCTCWEESHIPQDLKDAKIITLYKNKGDRADYNNYRGISLLSVVGKVLARVMLKRLQVLAESVYPEIQCGFRAGRSTTDMSFTLCLLQEKSCEQQAPLHVAFVDLQKAFDMVSRNGIYKILSKIGCPQKVLSLFKEFHEGMKAIIQYEDETSSEFSIDTGMKQGCVLVPTSFGIFFSILLKYTFGNDQSGILIEDLLFADDTAFVFNSPDELQNMMNKFSDACTKFSMVISIKKTVVTSQGTNISPKIYVNNEALDNVDHFCYLGSTLTSSLSLDRELDVRIGKASVTFGRLTSCVWNNKLLTLNTKVSIYQACVLSTLLYGCESWVTYSKQERRLNSFYLRCLRKILGVTWDQRITNNEVLERTGLQSMQTTLDIRRLCWLGHVEHMPQDRLLKAVLYGQLKNRPRRRGRPKLRYSDKKFSIPTDSWENPAHNHSVWRSRVKAGAVTAESHQ
uniref:Reverse transcriptase domain-containing protein n=1 Tax=Latimeria chalumnae TaxID=7897 RepID=H3ASA6_LATCH